jgi:hypothetical protein
MSLWYRDLVKAQGPHSSRYLTTFELCATDQSEKFPSLVAVHNRAAKGTPFGAAVNGLLWRVERLCLQAGYISARSQIPTFLILTNFKNALDSERRINLAY